MEGDMPNKDMGLKKKNRSMYMGGGNFKKEKSPMSSEYRSGGRLYMGGGGTEMGKETKSYKEYVKKMFGGGMTSQPAMKKKKM
jgi:hypothetical protein|tara:strand:- start:3578 stop:3826 length:249 start_codon:yes stop_codon:yes gene_type:complete